MSTYFVLSALPPLGELGTAPSLTAAALRDLLAGDDRDAVDAVLLGDDLAQHVALTAGETIEPSPAVLSAAQLRGRLRLPEPLDDDNDTRSGGASAERLYARYFGYVVDAGRRTGVPLLGAWARYEVALLNALADVRAKHLGRSLADHNLMPDLDVDPADVAPVVKDWLHAKDPLDGERRLERARWAWIAERDDWFGFSRTELVAYALRLVVLQRWQTREAPMLSASPKSRATPTGDVR